MEKIEVKAKTLDAAIEEAASRLGVAQDELDIDIIEQGGMFKKACVRASIKEGAKKPEPAPAAPAPKTVTAEQPTSRGEELALSHKFEKKHDKEKATPITRPAPCAVDVSGAPLKIQKTVAFVQKLIELLDNDSTVTTDQTDNAFNINVTGENIGKLIGKNGMVMNAIQTIVSSIARNYDRSEKSADGIKERTRVNVNIGDYKEKRVDSVQAIAMKKVEYVKRTGKMVKLDPMNPRERAIVHTALQNIEGIKTYSTGKEPFRCLCIAPADDKK